MVRTVCFLALIALASATVFAQTCTTYVVVDPFDGKTERGIDGLKAEDFEARMGNASLPVISATQSFNNRVLVLTETSGSADNKEVMRWCASIAAKRAERQPDGQSPSEHLPKKRSSAKNFLTDPQKRSSAIDEVLTQAARLPGKIRSLFDSLHQALAAFGPHQPGDTILLLTDGHDNKSKRNLHDMDKGVRCQLARACSWSSGRNCTPPGFPILASMSGKRIYPAVLSSSTGGAYTSFKSDRFLEFAWAGYLLGIQLQPPSTSRRVGTADQGLQRQN